MQLTKLRIKFPFSASTRVVRKAWTAADLSKKWAETKWAQKLENKQKVCGISHIIRMDVFIFLSFQRANMGDLDRFKLSIARSQRNKLRTTAFKHLKGKGNYL
jgi:large subunit ribosomal protein L14e